MYSLSLAFVGVKIAFNSPKNNQFFPISVTVLLAPQSYYSHDFQKYNIRINYSIFRDWFSQRGCDRSAYFASLFELAIAKRNSTLPPDTQTTEYRKRVWEIADAEFPELKISPPGDVSGYGNWVSMSYPGFSITYKIFKLGDCVVYLQLNGRRNDVAMLEHTLKH
ncbi:hypothetical protein IQ272_28080 [Chroococcidiopsidales cyanobacterium LEGE 13417]|uniref:hypothetical protein n=1 Tax=Chroococcidiopsis sp. CCALA 051 TaxID=869949 RepID=UPI0011B27E0B|nr:hypothetical protein [Chroococcidiopsis sp. CCALA 051]MBE9019917.1 hypothetical protein [Chroococcidiopsidales cyanobacterium LEGE 13417]